MSAPDLTTPQQRTGRAFGLALFTAAIAWSFSSRLLSENSARGLTNRFNADWATPMLGSFFLLFLLAVGYSLLEIISRRPTTARQVLGLPKRPTATREWFLGAALGWAMVAFTVLPMALAGDLHIGFWLEARAWNLLLINLATVAVASLADEVIFRGYPFRRLIEAIGPVAATLGMSLLYALRHALHYGAGKTAIFISIVTGIVFSISWLRTYGLWMAWGMRFAWTVSMGMLFGLPVSGSTDSSTIIQTSAVGSSWLTGADYGPEGSFAMLLALIAGLIFLVRITRDYAWNYTHPEILPGGYPMDIAPPPAHTAMEEAAKTKQSTLVQILPATPEGRSAGSDPTS